jgi:NAD-reducing hydrogenase large subunit
MSRVIKIDPVTRVEGHGRVTLHLADDGSVEKARFHVVEFRGFEKFCEGRHFSEMPTLTERICGICPVSHHLAAAKALDMICQVTPPRPARMLRELMHMGQLIQSHALSFFHLSAPDLLLGFDAPPEQRNIFGLIAQQPDIARRGIGLRKFGQDVIAAVADRKIHPDFCVPGGVNRALTAADRDGLRARIVETKSWVHHGLALLRDYFARDASAVAAFGTFPSYYMGLLDADGALEHYDGLLRVKAADGAIVEDAYAPSSYLALIAEATEDWSYLKFPFYRAAGYPEGSYRVGPLARLNVCNRVGTPEADAELTYFRSLAPEGSPPNAMVEGSMYFHYARLIEILFGIERVERLLDDPEILSDDLIAESTGIVPEGIGVIEAPRGTLFHHYTVDDHGGIERVNLIIASGQNNQAMNQAVTQVAKDHVKGNQLQESMLNMVEAAIRCYDPCLSCSTHALGKMPLRVELYSPDAQLLDEVSR